MKNKTKAVILIICSAFCFCCMSVFVRMAGDVPSIQKSFFRNLVAVAVAIFIIYKKGDGFHPKRENYPLFFLRSLFGTIGILCNFYAVDHLLLANASVLNKMSPFFVLIFSYFILHETLTPFQVGAVALAFAGALFVIKPSFSNADMVPSVVGLISGISAGLAYTLVRKLSLRGEKGSTIVLIFSSFSCLAVLPWVLTHWQPMTWQQLGFLILAGVSAAGGQFTVTGAYSYAPGREVSVYDYFQILFAAALGFFLFGDVPDVYSVLGYLLIISAALAVFWYNNRKIRER